MLVKCDLNKIAFYHTLIRAQRFLTHIVFDASIVKSSIVNYKIYNIKFYSTFFNSPF